MARLLQIMVIVLLLLGIGALVMGIMVFNEREVIKGRTQSLEQNAVAVARSLHFDGLTRQDQLMDFTTLPTVLNSLNVHAGLTWQELQDTIQDLANTRLDLEQTREELRVTQGQLEDARQQIVQLRDDLAERTAELARANQQIATLEREKNTMQARIDDFEVQVATLEEEKMEMAETIEDQRIQIAELEAIAYPEIEGAVGTPPGLSGEIMVVNPEWNFVVLNVGSEQGLSVHTEMLVHREDHLVGRVRVSSVKTQNAIAEIMTDWQQAPLREGDHVLF